MEYGHPYVMFQMEEKGQVYKDGEGYYRFSKTDSDTIFWFKNKLFHRWMMEVRLERRLVFPEVVHHLDGMKTNNQIDNLQLTTWENHKSQHTPGRNLYRNHCEDCTKDWLKRNDCSDCYAKQRYEEQEIDDESNCDDGWWES